MEDLPALLTGGAAIIVALAQLIWALRKHPKNEGN